MRIKVIRGNILWFLGRDEKVLVNPSQDVIGTKKYESRIVLFTREELDFLGLNFDGVVIRGPGEYEVGGVEINGVDANGDGVVYLVNLDGVLLGVMDGLTEAVDEKLEEKISGVDVLLVLARSGQKADCKSVLAVAKKWGVNYLVPVGFGSDSLEALLDAVDSEGLQAVNSLKVEKETLPDGMEVVLLSSE